MLQDTPSPLRRTRAQHSLAGSSLEEREEMLQDTPSPVSGTGGDDSDNAGDEWQHFLSSVRQPDLARPPPAQRQHEERSRKRSRVRFDDGEARLAGSSGTSHKSKRGERRSRAFRWRLRGTKDGARVEAEPRAALWRRWRLAHGSCGLCLFTSLDF